MRNLIIHLFSFVLFLSFSSLSAQSNIVDKHLQTVAQLDGLTSTDIQDYSINNAHTSSRSNLTHYYLKQRINGIEIFETQSSIHTTEGDSLFKYNNAFISNISQKVETSTASLSHRDAINSAIQLFGYDNANMPQELESSNDPDSKKLFSGGSISQEPIPIKLMYYVADNDMLRLCYDLSIYEVDHTDWWSLKVDANTGAVVSQINWVVECKFDHIGSLTHQCSHGHACKAEIKGKNTLMTDSYNVYPVPIESPNHGARVIETNPADALASPFGWHDTNGVAGPESTRTRGNNVNAQEDENGNNGTGYAPDGTATLNFDFPIDFNQAPTVNRDASLTNLFYWNNVIHDVFYQYGFDESAGNFQENNYGNGGSGSDRVNADGLDGSGTNNANFATPPDGSNPRMQMFLWSPGSINTTTINSPSNIDGSINGITANYGSSNFSITEDLVLVDDGTANASQGCNALTNAAAVSGKIALIDRGNCEFGVKSLNAQNAGAIAVVICQNTADAPFEMAPGVSGGSVTIPNIMISRENCDSIKAYLPNVNITLVGSSTGQEVDGSFDNGIIAHEYGHGISIRLTGGSANSGCLNNTEQMGEGWSDWFGMVMTIEPGDVGTTGRGVGTYAISQNTSGGGIRAFPYSTDLSVDPRTYNDISTASVPHGIGSVWSAMLWEMTWALIDTYGFDTDLYNGTGGNNIALALVTEALKLQPCSPGFIDGRDAILSADLALYNGQNTCLIWDAFAKRGLGDGATQGSTNSRSDGAESFSTPTICDVLEIKKTVDASSVIAGDVLTYSLVFDNQTTATYTNLVISDTILESMTYVPGSVTGGATFSNDVIELTVPTVSANTTVEVTFQVTVDGDLTTATSDFVDDAESGQRFWFTDNFLPSAPSWKIDNGNPFAGTDSWFAENLGTASAQILTLKTPKKLTANSELRFWHTYNTLSNQDGGKVFISNDNQATWVDLDPFITQNGYDNFLDSNPTDPAFGGNSPYIETIADLSSFADDYVYIQFISYHSGSNIGTGWSIDDITLTETIKSVSNIGYFTASPGIDEQHNIFPAIDVIPATCDDGIQNGAETGVDSGGSCPPTTGPCEFDLVLDGNPAPGDITFQAENEITSTANVGPNTIYQANCILLESDFEVVIGNEFLAEINPCTAFTNNNELTLKIVNTNEVDGEFIIQVDVNIPESGDYLINLDLGEGKLKTIPAKNMKRGVHRITVENLKKLSAQEIQIVKQ